VLSRLGFRGRLILIVLLVLMALSVFAIGVSFISRSQDANAPLRFPLPDQAAAIAEMLETASGAERDVVLRAVNSGTLRVAIAPQALAQDDSTLHLPFAEWLVTQYLPAMRGREVQVFMDIDPDAGWITRANRRFSPASQEALRIAIALRGGEWVIFETRGAPLLRVYGLPTGFWIGALGALLAAAAILVISREAHPLKALAQSVEQFGREAAPKPLTPAGAPELRSLISASNAMQTRIAELVRGRTLLLGAISHDLKTYLTRLRLRVEDIPDMGQQARAMRDIDEMTGIIDDALSLAKGAPSRRRPEAVDLSVLLRDEVSHRSAQAIRLGDALSQAPAGVTGDPAGLRRICANLLDNAASYAKSCDVSLTRNRSTVTLVVDDDGPGIPLADREAVFEPFNRLDASRSRQTGGSGLGLAIVKQIAEAHGGTVSISRSPAGGARVSVTLPAAVQAPA
jgi:two-component system, OmpR family, osmolarity sensor histidine kinase EnvZ